MALLAAAELIGADGPLGLSGLLGALTNGCGQPTWSLTPPLAVTLTLTQSLPPSPSLRLTLT